jgi:superfamily II DNA or RNA helicase
MSSVNSVRVAALGKVRAHMHLRRPQEEALEKLHHAITLLGAPLAESSNTEVAAAFGTAFPTWGIPADQARCPECTVNLATGVGKTKFIGAVIAYLCNAGESRNFLIVTPRAEVIRKFIRELHPEHPKYIFSDKSVIRRPTVITVDNIDAINLNQLELMDPTELYVWVISPQAFTAKNAKIKSGGDFGGPSTDILRAKNDLVVLFDESHHLGTDQRRVSSWRQEIRNLQPRLIIGTTASVPSKTNILYSYDLKTCLRDKLYTKQVQIIGERLDASMSDEERDHVTLRYALERRQAKEAAVAEYASMRGADRTPLPLLLVCCANIQHAEQVYERLIEQVGSTHVRLIHSEMAEGDYLDWLIDLEKDGNEIRVIVQVSMLNEGWDVSTVYVICPLRQMNSLVMVEQVMGRGLRLPFGAPTGVRMVDELDVVCFGRETVQELANAALAGGYGADDSGIGVTAPKGATNHIPSVDYVLESAADAVRPKSISIPTIRRRSPLLDLSQISIPRIPKTNVHAFEITDPRTIRALGGRPMLPRHEVVSAASGSVIRHCRYLSESRQRRDMEELIEKILSDAGVQGDLIGVSPEALATHVKAGLDAIYCGIPPEYYATGTMQEVSFVGVKTKVPHDYSTHVEAAIGNRADWNNRRAQRMPIGGWKRCVHFAVPFDAYHEFTVARCIDRCGEVDWWLRNLPNLLTLDTPAGRYSPDFAVFLNVGGKRILLEVKGDVFAGSGESTAQQKKRAAELWCDAVSKASTNTWEYWFLLDSDAARCVTWADIVSLAERG